MCAYWRWQPLLCMQQEDKILLTVFQPLKSSAGLCASLSATPSHYNDKHVYVTLMYRWDVCAGAFVLFLALIYSIITVENEFTHSHHDSQGISFNVWFETHKHFDEFGKRAIDCTGWGSINQPIFIDLVPLFSCFRKDHSVRHNSSISIMCLLLPFTHSLCLFLPDLVSLLLSVLPSRCPSHLLFQSLSLFLSLSLCVLFLLFSPR